MNPNIGNDNCPTCCANRREDRRIVDECDDVDTYCPDPWHATPTPPATADDARPMVTGGGLIKFDRRADDASGAEAKPAAWAIRDRHGQYSDPSRDEAKIRHDCDYLNRDSSTPYYIGQGPYEVVPLAPLPTPDDAGDAVRVARLDETLHLACLWFDATIPHEASDDVTKFREESREFLDNPSVEEAADAVLCLVHWAHLTGSDLHAAIRAKMAKNAARKWERRPDGTWHHVAAERAASGEGGG